MGISKKLLNYLEKSKYRYEIVEHRKTYTAWDTSQTEKIDPREVGKALVLKCDNEYMVALVPAHRRLDKKKFLKAVNVERKKKAKKSEDAKEKKRLGKSFKKVDLAKEAWMKKNIPGKVGAVPPFTNFLKLEIYADRLLLKNRKVYLGSGEYEASIRVSTDQFVKKESPVPGSFSVKK